MQEICSEENLESKPHKIVFICLQNHSESIDNNDDIVIYTIDKNVLKITIFEYSSSKLHYSDYKI